jgi:hypothetical protein
VNVICPGLFSSHMSTASFKSVDDPQNCQEWGVHSSVFSVFFLMSKFRVPTIFLARNSGFYGFLKNETLLMFDIICQILLTFGEIDGHCPLKFGDG